eukprot:20951-Heterococcus_DN1.PRE.2
MEEAIGQAADAQHRKDVAEAKTHVADDPLALLTKEDLAVTASQLLLPNETVLKAIKRYAKKDKALSEQERAATKAAFESMSCSNIGMPCVVYGVAHSHAYAVQDSYTFSWHKGMAYHVLLELTLA